MVSVSDQFFIFKSDNGPIMIKPGAPRRGELSDLGEGDFFAGLSALSNY